MKPNIHPEQKQVLAKCICGNEFHFDSSVESEVINIEICNKCHPFFTGKQQIVKVAGRVENFASKFANFKDKQLKIREAALATEKSKPTAKKAVKKSGSTRKSKVGVKVDQQKKSN